MKALVYTNLRELTYLDVAETPPSIGEAQVKIEVAGICGSDLHAWNGHDSRRVPPLILGHEACGIVQEGKYCGKRVVLNPLISCNQCDDCLSGRTNLCPNRAMIGMTRPGCFAEYVTIPEQCLLPIPEDMDPITASLTEPAATVVHATNLVTRIAHRPIHEGPVLIIGAGAIGLLSALFLHHLGCGNVTILDTNTHRLKKAKNAGVANILNPSKGQVPENHYPLVIDAVGSNITRANAIKAVRHGGVIMIIGLQEPEGAIDARKITLSEIALLGTYTYTELDLKATISHLYHNHFGDLSWVEKRSITEGGPAFNDLHNGKISSGKVVLIPE